MTNPSGKLSHLDAQGHAHMVDVGAKDVTQRVALARGRIHMEAATLRLIRAGGAKKGDVIAVARVAAIQGAKKTSELIPLCHPLMLTRVAVEFEFDEATSEIECTCRTQCSGQTGVEMEALTGVSVALLTIYDMCKAVDRAMTIGSICLVEKQGGKSDYLRTDPR